MNELTKPQQDFKQTEAEKFTLSLEIRTGPEDGRSLTFATRRMLIGRQLPAPDPAEAPPITNFLIRSDKSISREHCQLTIESPNKMVLEDLNSRFGTYLNGKKVTSPVECHVGDTMKLGDTEILLR